MQVALRGSLPGRLFISIPAYGPTNFMAETRDREEIQMVKNIALTFRPKR